MSEQDSINKHASSRLDTHEAVCAYRYATIEARLKRLESILMRIAGAALFGMAGILWTVLYTR